MTHRLRHEGGTAKGKIIPFPGKRSVSEENVTRREDITVSGLAALMGARQAVDSDNNDSDSKNAGKNSGIKAQAQRQDPPASVHVARQPDGTAAA